MSAKDSIAFPTAGRIVNFVLGDGQIRPAIVCRTPDSTHETALPKLQLQVFIDRTADRQHGKHAGENSGRAAIMIIDAAGQTQKVVDAENYASQVPYADPGAMTPGSWHWPVRT